MAPSASGPAKQSYEQSDEIGMTVEECTMVLVTHHEPHAVIEILRREIDPLPSLLRSVLTLNVRYFVGASSVCGCVSGAGFELRNRKGPGFSLRAKGTVSAAGDGYTEIVLSFTKPTIPDLMGVLLFNRYRWDRQAILSFLESCLGAVEREESRTR